jgi:phytoene synthase
LGCRTGIAAARRIYAAIGRQIRLAGYDSITRRARVSGRRKLGLAGRALADGFFVGDATAPALPANMFLVTAAAIAPVPPEPNGFEKLINMFERLERAQREGAAATPDGRLA